MRGAAPAALALLAALDLLEVHGPDGQAAFINPTEISSLRQPTAADLHRYFPKNVRCIVVTSNGRFLATVETCRAIHDRLIQSP